ncbi:MAG TPA: HGxxPAAW family protein [Streptosporangiaceae bacterium]|nr:HGxxPAAW family protein [Streptosporangiaceae bacterium]
MADQAASGAMAETGDTGARGLDSQIAPSYVHEEFHGRPASWVASSIVIAGFIIGGIALPIGPTWWLFWTGVGIVVLGAIIGAAVHIFDDWY